MLEPINAVKEKKILIRLFLTLFLTALSMIIILSALIFNWARDKALNDINTITELTMHNILQTITETFASTQNTIYEIYHNNNIDELSKNNNILAIMEASYYLDTIMSVNSEIKGIHIFNDKNMILSKSNGINSDFDRIYNLAKVNDILKPINNVIKDNYGNIRELITFIYSEKELTQSGNNGLYIAIDIEPKIFKEEIYMNYRDAFNCLFVINNEGRIILSLETNGYSIDKSFENMLIESFSKTNSNTGNKIIRVGNKKHIANYLYDENRKYCLIVSNDLDILNFKISDTKKLLLNSFAALLLSIVTISLFISKKLYMPINSLFNFINKYIRNINKNNDDYQSYTVPVSKAVNRMINNINSIECKNIADYQYTRQLLLKEILTGKVQSNNPWTISKIIEYKLVPDHKKPYILILFKFNNKKELSDCIMQKLLMEEIPMIINTTLKSITVLSNENNETELDMSIESCEDELIIIINVGECNTKEIFEKPLKNIQKNLYDRYNIMFSIGVSSITKNVSEMCNAYIQASNLIGLRIIRGNDIVLFYDEKFDMKMATIQTQFEPDKQIDLVLESIKKCDEKAFYENLGELFNQCMFFDYRSILTILLKLYRGIYKVQRNIDPNLFPAELNEVNIMEMLKNINDKDELFYLFKNLYKNNEIILNNINNNKTIYSIKNVVEYISANYWDTNITASMFAEKLSITPQHFSRLFKQYIGLSFPDYVNDIRLKKAKELIDKYMELSINEISLKAGFNNSSYFSKAFRNMFGVTPTRYKQNLQDAKFNRNIAFPG